MELRQSTSQVIRFGPFLDSTDGVTPETGLTILQSDMQLSKDGAAFAQKNAAGNATHDTDGYYFTTLNTTDSNTTAILKLQVNVAGALPVWENFDVVTQTYHDAKYTGTFNNLGGIAQTEDHTESLDTIEVDVGKVITAVITNAAGVDISEDVAAVKTDTTATLIDTGTTLPNQIDNLNDIAATEIVSNGAITTLSGAVVNVDLVDVTTTNTDMRGTDGANTVVPDNAGIAANGVAIDALQDISVTDILTTQMVESYAADGVAPSLAQGIFLTMQNLQDYSYAGTTQTVRRIDGSSTAATYTLDDAINPTSKTRTT